MHTLESAPQPGQAALQHEHGDAPVAAEQLLKEGIQTIGTVHFEGRGDPLANPNLGKLIQLSKQYFPTAVTMVTTHASYPYKPWLTTCDLDILKASIDGAFADSYEKYRVGGNLDKALSFLRTLRDERRRATAPMKVFWKYILFEWNDTDEEMRHAASLAAELECDLQFVLTHSPGRSQRFTAHDLLQQHLREIGIAASHELTYQMKPGVAGVANEATAAEFVQTVYKTVLKYAQENNTQDAVKQLARALAHDPGLSSIEDHGKATIRVYLNQILPKARFSLTLSWLAAISRVWEDAPTAAVLLQRYLELAPNAPDRDHVRQELHNLNCELRSYGIAVATGGTAAAYVETVFKATLEYAQANNPQDAVKELLRALALDPGLSPIEDHGNETIRFYLKQILSEARFPLTLSWLAAISRVWEDAPTAAVLLQRYLELAPNAPDRDHCLRELPKLTSPRKTGNQGVATTATAPMSLETVFETTLQCAQANKTQDAVKQLLRALALDPGLSPVEDHGKETIRFYLNQILSEARFPLTLSWLAAISREWGDGESSAALLWKYLELAPDAPDRVHVLRELPKLTANADTAAEGTGPDYVETVLKATLEYAQANNTQDAVKELLRALALDPGLSSIEDHGKATIRFYLNQILSGARFPLTLTWLAAISREWRDRESSATLLRKYLELAPNALDRVHVLHELRKPYYWFTTLRVFLRETQQELAYFSRPMAGSKTPSS